MHNLADPVDDPPVDDGHRRGRILRALAACMAEKGYQATTIADIARAGRVSKTIVYAHFRDKEQCLLELYSRATDHVLRTVSDAQEEARAAGLPWRERMRVVIGAQWYSELIHVPVGRPRTSTPSNPSPVSSTTEYAARVRPSRWS